MRPVHWFFWGIVVFVAVCALVAAWQTWRQLADEERRRRSWFAEHDKLEPR